MSAKHTPHTPGPWTIDSRDANREHWIDGQGWDQLAVAYGNYDDDELNREGIANARIIAAAPDLADALEALVAPGGLLGSNVKRARAALRKAGRLP